MFYVGAMILIVVGDYKGNAEILYIFKSTPTAIIKSIVSKMAASFPNKAWWPDLRPFGGVLKGKDLVFL